MNDRTSPPDTLETLGDPLRARLARVGGEALRVVESLEGAAPALLSLMRLGWAGGGGRVSRGAPGC